MRLASLACPAGGYDAIRTGAVAGATIFLHREMPDFNYWRDARATDLQPVRSTISIGTVDLDPLPRDRGCVLLEAISTAPATKAWSHVHHKVGALR